MHVELTVDQFDALIGLGYRPFELVGEKLETVIPEAVAAAYWELERIAERGRRTSDCLDPEEVLAAFDRPFQTDAPAVLRALDPEVGSLPQDVAEAKLVSEVANARKELARAARAAKSAGGAGAAESFMFSPLGSGERALRHPLRIIRWEPARRAVDGSDRAYEWDIPEGWETEGPWGDSLAWLEQQSRPEPAEACSRCNWPRRFRGLIGLDDGTKPLRLLGWAQPGSTGALRQFLERYRRLLEPIDNMQAHGDRSCALCGGRGYLDPLEWASDPRLRKPVARTSPEWNRGSVPPVLAVALAAVDCESDSSWDVSRGAVATEQENLASQIADTVARFGNTGRLALEGLGVEEHKRDYAENAHRLESLPLRQFLAYVQFGGGGRLTGERRDGFYKRDASILGLVLAGFDVKTVARAVGLSEKQLYSLRVVRLAREAFMTTQRGLILDWHDRGYPLKAVAQAAGVPISKVRRIVKDRHRPLPPLQESPVFKLIPLLLYYGPALRELEPKPDVSVADSAPIDSGELLNGVPIDYYERRPPGMPLQSEPDEPYHSYVPAEDDRHGAPAGVRTHSAGMLHPFLYALLDNARVDRRRKFACAPNAGAI